MTLKNIDNKYRIIVKNEQTIDNETDTIEEIAYGTCSEKNGKNYILYRTENDGDDVSSMIKIEDDCVTIKRSGSINSTMMYKVGEKNSFLYEIPYGKLEMEIETHRLISDFNENGGSLELVYTLTVQGEKYFNNMKISAIKR